MLFKSHTRWPAVLVLLAVSMFILAGCVQSSPDPTEPPSIVTQPPTATFTIQPPTATVTLAPTFTPTSTFTPEPTPTPLSYGPDNFPAGVNPLTGLMVADPSLLDRKPIAVKVQLFPRFGRPPWGLNQADIVYEYYQNHGVTRLHAIFYGNEVDLIGPIRSARLPDHELIQMYKSIFAYGSADSRVNARLFNASYSPYLVLEGALSECPPTERLPMCRYDPSGQQLLLTGTAALTAFTERQNLPNEAQDLTGMRFEPAIPQGGVGLEQFTLRYSGGSYHQWNYDALSGTYLRSQDVEADNGGGEVLEPLVDRATGETLAAENVIVIYAGHSFAVRTAAVELVEINLSGTGKALVMRDGQFYETTWARFNPDDVMTFLNPDGSRFPLKPGRTWIMIVGLTSALTPPADGQARLVFDIP